MLKQNSKYTRSIYIPFAIAAISLLAVGCTHTKPNTLQRPEAENNIQTNSAANDNNGQVAGDITPLPTKTITVKNYNVLAEIADDDTEREQGLSGREKLEDGNGMLFDFSNTDFHKPGFWMKDMLISIDIIWIDHGKIVGIEANAPLPPEDKDLPVYYPPSAITHVLEVPAGWSARNNVRVGDAISL